MNEAAEIELEAPRNLPNDGVDARQISRRFQASSLFGNAREVFIEHGGDEYRLRITNAGKLILTK